MDHAVALLNGRAADRLREVALAGAEWPEKEHVLTLRDETRGGELVDERAIHLLAEIKVTLMWSSTSLTSSRCG